ncbi:ACP phosphodiesterase [Niveibacterium sp. SC-1]|uniref:acyl carrier protein phosphodiesterase n=1 Tax=Niveibacterium sp. SC-1 TaxID=3135646 RepID=UPI00311DD674
MNYLAHAYLAAPDADCIVGGVMGDFVKGPLPGALAPALARGVGLHRAIDSYAETHPAFQRSRARVSAGRRRVSGIMVDLFYDHFLAQDWARYVEEPLAHFSARVYALLAAQPALPERLEEVLPLMRTHDWLQSYARIEVVGRALDRMARYRLRQPNPLEGALEELQRDYAGFATDFAAFLPDARDFAQDWLAQRPLQH